ncbi:pyocin knob domain-containing protein [Lactococcus lactis]|uniref:pyocin knob domain-containing protein n=1 Tax=Lactococcus lactis TaxID=1358 RepID=UPI00071DC0B9|nr:pyocin knob domain-containing protein [Lactococcus lactis]KST88223.1 Phage tail assembly [Lactococcus lactis subsp. lactis]
MSYEKQTWNKYDELKTEEENIENGAVVTDNRMNHMESGIGDNDNNLASHLADKNNPHKVTAAQVGLGNVQNFGLATEDEAKQGISNAKYMTPSLTQAVLSANINSIAYANSADGTDRFTTVYPKPNLLNGTKVHDIFKGTGTQNAGGTQSYTLDKNLKISDLKLSKYQDLVFEFDWKATGTNLSGYFLYQTQTYYKGTGVTISPTNTSGHVKNNFYNLPVTTDNSTIISIRQDNIPTTVTVEISNLMMYIVDYSPWIPSATEVTTADWPKYVGFSNTVKTNKSANDYTWFPVKDSELTNKVDSHVNNKSNPHAVTASQVGAYTKSEADAKFATGQTLTDLSNKVIANKGNLASGTDLNNVTDTGFYRIGGLVGGTDVLNVPSELSGLNFYAFLTVTGSLQELTVYSPRQDATWTYSRSVSGSTPIWSSWSKTVMADDSGKVTVTRIETTSDVRTWVSLTLSNAGTAVLRYKKINGVVYLYGEGNWGSFTAGQSKTICTLPPELRPDVTCNYVITTQNGSGQPMELQVQTGGNVNLWSGLASGGRYGGFVGNYPLP